MVAVWWKWTEDVLEGCGQYERYNRGGNGRGGRKMMTGRGESGRKKWGRTGWGGELDTNNCWRKWKNVEKRVEKTEGGL